MSSRISERSIAMVLALAGTSGVRADVSPHAGMLRFPDVSGTHIVFAYANDLWIVPREGGVALPLASPPGTETFPRFSDDGQTIAFMGNYDGNTDLYTLPLEGGVPARVTHHPLPEILTGWAGDRLVFFTNANAGLRRQTQIYTVPASGGLPEKLPVPYGANGAISSDGQWLAYTPHTVDTRTWKRYRGGMQTDIWLFNLTDKTSKRMTDWEGVDSQPMWHGGKVYYMTDQGPEHRANIWVYDPADGSRKQVTSLTEYDIKWPSIGPGPKGKGEIVFQYGPELRLLDLGTGKSQAVEVAIPGDRPKLREQGVDVSGQISSWDISPSGKRAVVSARGDVWTLPAENGTPRNLTRTDGVFERDPAWSPDGKWIAYFADASGEYELYVVQSDGKGEPKQLTSGHATFFYGPVWSPDSKRIVFTDKGGGMHLYTLAVEAEGDTPAQEAVLKTFDTDPWANQQRLSWSHDSRWIAYSKQEHESNSSAVWVYDVENSTNHRLTSGFFADGSPSFDNIGDYLYFASSRTFSPTYGDLDTTFIYQGTQVLVAMPLRADVESPWLPKSDEEDWKKAAEEAKKKAEEKAKAEKAKQEKKDAPPADEAKKEDKPSEEKPAEKPADDAKAEDPVSGSWDCKATGGDPLPPGGMPFTLSLTLGEGGSVSGSMSSVMHSGSISNGKFDASSKALTFSIATPNGSADFSLTISDGSMSGTVTVMGQPYTITGSRTSTGAGEEKKDESKPGEKREKVTIDFDGIEARAMVLPVPTGRFGLVSANDKGHVIYARFPVGDGDAGIKIFDLKDEKKEEKQVTSGGGFTLSPDGKKLLAIRGNGASIMDASAGASGKNVVTSPMSASIDPRQEWAQIFADAWRVERDFFYDPTMHGVDWKAVREQYASMLDDCASREDLGFVISEMISEMNVGHAYYQAGSTDVGPSMSVGMLGCDFELDSGAYRISRIYRGAAWDLDAVGPLGQPGVKIKPGHYLLAVNGVAVDPSKDPWAAFQGLADKTVTLTVSEKPALDDTAIDVVITTIGDDANLRYRAWIESKRAYVEEKTKGQAGYVYVPDTGINGQNNLVRQFFGQTGKAGLIFDERWNGGGQIPTRFIELMNRPITNYWARRDGNDWSWPPDAHQGPKVMLINGLAGSGGDMFPWLFRYNKLGAIIGTRTWGGLVGISGNPGFIDGTSVTAPTFAFYEKDGTWGVEGHGVDPDIEVIDDPALMTDGGDPQLDAAIAQILKDIAERPYVKPARPAYPDRKGMGVPKSDW